MDDDYFGSPLALFARVSFFSDRGGLPYAIGSSPVPVLQHHTSSIK